MFVAEAVETVVQNVSVTHLHDKDSLWSSIKLSARTGL